MPNPITQAQPALEFIPPDFNPLVFRAAQVLMPLWRKANTPIAQIEAENVERLVELYRQFQQGKIRFTIAARHPSTHDPFAVSELLWRIVPQVAKEKAIVLHSPSHVHALYDRGIPLWAGQWVGWVFSKLGATPIQRGKMDRQGLRSARELFVNGLFPLAAGPEGATNGHNEIVSPLEPGIAQLAFWCVEDLKKADRPEQVLILPLGIQYFYIEDNWDAVESLLSRMETFCGLEPLQTDQLKDSEIHHSHLTNQAYLYPRLIRLGKHLLLLMEDFYRRFYHRNIPKKSAEEIELTSELPALLDEALKVAEEYFQVSAKGNVIDRCRRLEQAGWERIYREDIEDFEALSALERGLADRVAEEASLRMWHMRLVESFVAVTGQYVREKPTFERFAETTLLVWDTIARIKGEDPFLNRPELGPQRVKLTVGEPISVSDRAANYQEKRRSAIAELTKDLQTALENMIIS